METLKPKRPHLTSEQLDWATSVGLTAQRAYWLASCPMLTRCGTSNAPAKAFHCRPNRYLWKAGDVWCFRLTRTDQKIHRLLSKDLETARKMRDVIEKEINLTPRHKRIL